MLDGRLADPMPSYRVSEVLGDLAIDNDNDNEKRLRATSRISLRTGSSGDDR
ncbi:hypothetical protein ABZW96_13665 [Nocardia sp. NPDC004168]|uniref:hypothetical protein n=1 Tax=Nocardia sp. NPDC004168 TaxID=3154452 RepID=UPI0033ABA8F6